MGTSELVELKKGVMAAAGRVSKLLGPLSSCRTITEIKKIGDAKGRTEYQVDCNDKTTFSGLTAKNGAKSPKKVILSIEKFPANSTDKEGIFLGAPGSLVAQGQKPAATICWPKGDKGPKGGSATSSSKLKSPSNLKPDSDKKKPFEVAKPSFNSTGINGSVSGVECGINAVNLSLYAVSNVFDGLSGRYRVVVVDTGGFSEEVRGSDSKLKAFFTGLWVGNVRAHIKKRKRALAKIK